MSEIVEVELRAKYATANTHRQYFWWYFENFNFKNGSTMPSTANNSVPVEAGKSNRFGRTVSGFFLVRWRPHRG